MAFTIEMTPRGVLLAGGFRTQEELNHMPTENKRNTMIVELTAHTNKPVAYFGGFNDDALVGKLATSVFLEKAEIRKLAELKKMTDDDQRNTMVVEDNNHTDIPIKQLSAKSDKELVQLGLEWFSQANTIAAILEFQWNIDQQKVASTKPEIIATQTYDNRGSTSPMEEVFKFSKTVSNKSTFSHSHSLDVNLGVATKFKAGIPEIAQNETTVKVDVGVKNEWDFGTENTTSQTYEISTPVKVPPGAHIQRVGSVTSGQIDVGYRAKIRTGDGTIKWIEGTWTGVSTVNLISKQVDLKVEPAATITL